MGIPKKFAIGGFVVGACYGVLAIVYAYVLVPSAPGLYELLFQMLITAVLGAIGAAVGLGVGFVVHALLALARKLFKDQ
ncbi:hypothetical protein FJY63_09340 [Candidatus Sumerlaeota bacterium]|nr:hypothetical protein [Candidatus Sumerlaeota bacterium]